MAKAKKAAKKDKSEIVRIALFVDEYDNKFYAQSIYDGVTPRSAEHVIEVTIKSPIVARVTPVTKVTV